MALLSRFPVLSKEVRIYSDLLWRDLPGASLPRTTSGGFYSSDVQSVLRLHSSGAWDVPISLPDGVLHILTSHASPPVFDGPEDRNGRRNADELQFWRLYIGGWLPDGSPLNDGAFVLAGDLNNDPLRGEGSKPNLHRLLGLPDLQDPMSEHLPTVAWTGPNGPLRLRVDYVLPSRIFDIAGSGLIWPETGASEASRHALVWVDIVWP